MATLMLPVFEVVPKSGGADPLWSTIHPEEMAVSGRPYSGNFWPLHKACLIYVAGMVFTFHGVPKHHIRQIKASRLL